MVSHDKLLTARSLLRAGLPHPRTRLVQADSPVPELDGPVVVKPRFGSWGRDVRLSAPRSGFAVTASSSGHVRGTGPMARSCRSSCRTTASTSASWLRGASWSARSHAWRRRASGGRTLRWAPSGAGSFRPPPPASSPTACAAAAGADLLGVEMLPDGAGSYTVLELNGAVEFASEYALDGDPFVAAANELAQVAERGSVRVGEPRLAAGVGDAGG